MPIRGHITSAAVSQMLSKEPNLTPMVEVEEGVQDDLWGGRKRETGGVFALVGDGRGELSMRKERRRVREDGYGGR